MPDWLRRRLARMTDRQNRRRKNPSPEDVRECIEDCDDLIQIIWRLFETGHLQ